MLPCNVPPTGPTKSCILRARSVVLFKQVALLSIPSFTVYLLRATQNQHRLILGTLYPIAEKLCHIFYATWYLRDRHQYKLGAVCPLILQQ
jgi:hypothetical protein